MDLKEYIEKLYILKRIHLKRSRKRIKNKDFTLIASNCIGGMIYHNLGLQFKSPTINMQMYSNEFVDFVLNLENYMQKEIVFLEPDNGIPVGKLGDMTIHFTHYKSNEEALEKWEARKKRINYDNLYIILNDMDGITEEQIRSLKDAKCRNLCVFTAKDYPDIPYTFTFGKFRGQNCVGNILKKSKITGLRLFEEKFDYVQWLNSEKSI